MVSSPALPLRLGEDSEAAGLCKEPGAATRFQGRGKEGQARGRVRSGFHHLGVRAPGSLAPAPSSLGLAGMLGGSWEDWRQRQTGGAGGGAAPPQPPTQGPWGGSSTVQQGA